MSGSNTSHAGGAPSSPCICASQSERARVGQLLQTRKARPEQGDRNKICHVHVRTWAERYFGGTAEACEVALCRPNILFDHELRIDLGGKTVRLFPTPGHRPDGVCLGALLEFNARVLVLRRGPVLGDASALREHLGLSAICAMCVRLYLKSYRGDIAGARGTRRGLRHVRWRPTAGGTHSACYVDIAWWSPESSPKKGQTGA